MGGMDNSDPWEHPHAHRQRRHDPKTDKWHFRVRKWWLVIGVCEEDKAEKQEGEGRKIHYETSHYGPCGYFCS